MVVRWEAWTGGWGGEERGDDHHSYLVDNTLHLWGGATDRASLTQVYRCIGVHVTQVHQPLVRLECYTGKMMGWRAIDLT